MNKFSSPYAVCAQYTPQRIARLRDNKLIEALPPAPSDEELLGGLGLHPDFALEQREWTNHERIQQIKGLSNFLVPLQSHLELSRLIDIMMREGYVSRPLRSCGLQKMLQEIYTMQKDGKRFAQLPQSVGVQLSAALIGMPGMGKTTTAKRSLARYPLVIDHGDGVLQIPCIHVDMTASGTSIKSLAIAIISQIDRLVPDCNYADLYLSKLKGSSTEALIYAAARLVSIHHVGLIVADELQNLSSRKGVQTVMTELVTMCNTLNVPLLFIGTYKANDVLGADFRSSRRGIGGLSTWGPLQRYDSGALVPASEDEPSEFHDFVKALWSFQWVRNPVELTRELVDYLHDRTQGVLDLVIKLFAIAQVRAITCGAETVTQELLESVYLSDFALVHDALDAMRRRQPKALERFADVAPLDAETAVHKYEAGAQIAAQRAVQASRPGEPGFVQTVSKLLVGGGMAPETAAHLAQKADESKKAEAPLQAVARIVKEVSTKPSKRSPKDGGSGQIYYPDFSARAADYRRATALAAQQGTKVVEQLKTLGMLPDAEDLVPVF